MPKPVIEDFATILTKENMGPLFDTVWDALAAAKTPEEARDALSLYSKDETYTQDETDALVTSKVERGGDTMTGPLTLPALDPALDNHAARKAYVDRRVDEITNTAGKTGSPCYWWKDEKTGLLIQWGGGVTINAGDLWIVFAKPYSSPGAYIGLAGTAGGATNVDTGIGSKQTDGMAVYTRNPSLGAANVSINWATIGY